MPFRVSIRPALRWALAWNESSVMRSIFVSEYNETIRIRIMATTGGMIIHGEIHPNTARNSSTKGRSTRVVRLAEAMKSRTDSNERTFDAKDPPDTSRLTSEERNVRKA